MRKTSIFAHTVLSNAIPMRSCSMKHLFMRNERKISSLIVLCTFPLSRRTFDALYSLHVTNARKRKKRKEIASDCILVSYSPLVHAIPSSLWPSFRWFHLARDLWANQNHQMVDVAAFELIIWHVFVQGNECGIEIIHRQTKKLNFYGIFVQW